MTKVFKKMVEEKKNDHFYRVTYYRTQSETSVDHKNFFDFEEAVRFAKSIRTGNVIEIKKYEKIKDV